MAAVKIPHCRVWKNGEAMLLLQEWKDKNKQTDKQTNKTIILSKKGVYMARNKRISKSNALREQVRRRL